MFSFFFFFFLIIAISRNVNRRAKQANKFLSNTHKKALDLLISDMIDFHYLKNQKGMDINEFHTFWDTYLQKEIYPLFYHLKTTQIQHLFKIQTNNPKNIQSFLNFFYLCFIFIYFAFAL